MSRLTRAIICSVSIGIIGMIAGILSIGIETEDNLEEKIDLNLLFWLRGSRRPPSDIIIVSIDKDSADNLGLPSNLREWPRSYHARLTEILSEQGAAVIVFDMIFSERGQPDEDHSFARVIRKAGNVVLCQNFEQTPIEDIPVDIADPLEQSALALAPFLLPKNTPKKRHYWLFKQKAGGMPTLPVVAFQIFAFDVYDEFIQLLKKSSIMQDEKILLHKDAIKSNRQVEEQLIALKDYFRNNPEVGNKMMEEILNPDYLAFAPQKKRVLKALMDIYLGPECHYLNFFGEPGTIKTIPYYKILKINEESASENREFDFKGKAVFVGSSDNLRPNQQIDGYDTVYPGPNGIKMSGVEIAATAFANLIERKHVQPVIILVYFATLFFWGVLVGLLCFFFPPAISAIGIIMLSSFYLIFGVYQFKNSETWYPISIPLFLQIPLGYFGIFICKFIKLNTERQNIRNAFKYFLPESVVEKLALNIGDIHADTQIVYGTCLFTDGEQYTALSENMDPKELSIFMNSYYESVFKPVKQYGGIVSDVIGDSMLSIWATAQPDTNIRKNACAAALDIYDAVEKFKDNAKTDQLSTRIGLHSGYISIGNIGAIDHYEYRPVGDIVNTASRIENLNKVLGTRILISQEVLHRIDGFLTRKVGEFIFKGKSKPVVVYELKSHKEEVNEQQADLCEIFTEGLDAYYRQSWEEAIISLRQVIKINQQDGPSHYYLAKCADYRNNPPGDNWNGVIRLDYN